MKYRATLTDPGAQDGDRPKTTLSNSRQDIDLWTAGELAKAVSPDASVRIYETSEQLIDLKVKAKLEQKV